MFDRKHRPGVDPVAISFDLGSHLTVAEARRKIGPLHSELKRIWPEQFAAQQFTETHFRHYEATVGLPNGYLLEIEVDGPAGTFTFIPPAARKDASKKPQPQRAGAKARIRRHFVDAPASTQNVKGTPSTDEGHAGIL